MGNTSMSHEWRNPAYAGFGLEYYPERGESLFTAEISELIFG
jgi:hypothetical protein